MIGACAHGLTLAVSQGPFDKLLALSVAHPSHGCTGGEGVVNAPSVSEQQVNEHL